MDNMSKWKAPERPLLAKMEAYKLAEPFGPFWGVLEVGTRFPSARGLCMEGYSTETTTDPILNEVQTSGSPGHHLVIALHVLEHCKSPREAVECLWRLAGGYLLIEVPALEVELDEQEFDDINPGHLHHFSMGELLGLVGGSVMAVEAVRSGPWPCNRVLAAKGYPTIFNKKLRIAEIYKQTVDRIVESGVAHGDAYFGKSYSLRELIRHGAPKLPVYDTHKNPIPDEFSGRLILTPRYSPTRDEMKAQLIGREIYDPWTRSI